MSDHFKAVLFSSLVLLLSLSCAPVTVELPPSARQQAASEAPPASHVRFHDRTHELVSHAERLIAKNEMEGAVLDGRIAADQLVPDANGMRVVLVSIDGNRIYASRAGEIMEAILPISGDRPPSMVFLGSAGAIDEPELVGKIVVPRVVLNGKPFPAPRPGGVLVHIIRNRAIDKGRLWKMSWSKPLDGRGR